MGVVKLYKFVGEHDNLITGGMYTLKEYLKVSEVGEHTLQSRMIGYRYTEFDNNILSKRYIRPIKLLETASEVLMAKWLRIKLTTIDPNYKEHKR